MGNSKSSSRKSKSRDFLAVMRAEKAGRGLGDGSGVPAVNPPPPVANQTTGSKQRIVKSQRAESPKPKQSRSKLSKKLGKQKNSSAVSEEEQQRMADLESSFHGQSKVKRIYSFGSVSDAAVGALFAPQAADGPTNNLEGSVHRKRLEGSVHREDWSYHGKADVTMEGISNHGTNLDGSFNGGQSDEYSISRSTRATKASQLLMQPLSIDEAVLSGENTSSAIPKASIPSRKAQACCSRFGAGRDVIHTAFRAALEHICERFDWSYGEMWIVEEHVSMLRCCSHVSYQDPKLDNRLNVFKMACQNQIVESSSFLAGRPFENGGQHVWVPNLRMITQGVLATAPLARFNGLSSCVTIPVLAPSSNEILAYALLYDVKSRTREEGDMLVAVKATLGMVADLMIAYIRFSRGKLNRDVYRTAIKNFMEFKVTMESLSAATSPVGPGKHTTSAESKFPSTLAVPMELDPPLEDESQMDLANSMHAAPLGAEKREDVDPLFSQVVTSTPSSHGGSVRHGNEYLHFDEPESGESTKENAPETDTTRVEVKSRILFEVGIVEQHLSWAHSMDSVDHKMAIQVLSWLAHYYNLFARSFSADAYKEVEVLLKYLAETSPLLESESPVRHMAEIALDKLVTHKLMKPEDRESPFFGEAQIEKGLLSPVKSNMDEFRNRLHLMFEQHKQREKLEGMAQSLKPGSTKLLDFRVGEVFNATGQRAPGTVVASASTSMGGMWGSRGRGGPPQPGEAKRASDVCTSLLRNSDTEQLVTLDNLFKLHKVLDLTQKNMNGELRTGLAVGSHRFFESYRVFAPPGEIPFLLREMEAIVGSKEYEDWNPVQKSFFVFGSLVWFIHPFVDGNGRTARLFGNLILKQFGFPAAIRSTDKVLDFEDFCDLVVDKYEAQREFFGK